MASVTAIDASLVPMRTALGVLDAMWPPSKFNGAALGSRLPYNV